MDLAEKIDKSPSTAAETDILVKGCDRTGDVWTFVGRRPEQRLSLFTADWRIQIDPDTSLSDPHLEEIREDSRSLLLSLWTSPPQGRTALGGQSLARAFACMRTALIWLITNGICSWANVTPSTALEYLSWLKSSRLNAAGELKNPSTLTLSRYLDVFKVAFLQRSHLRGKMRVDPLLGESSSNYCGVKWSGGSSIPAIPIRDARVLVAASKAIVEAAMARSSEGIAAMYQAVEAHVKDKFGARVEIYLNRWGRYPDNLYEEILRTACLVHTDLSSGLRMSELRYLRVGCSSVQEIGSGRVTLIEGHLLKHRSTPEAHKWVSPIDTHTSIACLELISTPHRNHNLDYLLAIRPLRVRPATYDDGEYYEVLSEWRANRDFRKLWNLIGLEDPERPPSYQQCRKTVAKILASVLHHDMLSVSYQLGHLSQLVTDQGYYRKYFQDLDDEIKEAVVVVAMEKLGEAAAHPLGGIAGEYLEAKLRNEHPTMVPQKRALLLKDLVGSSTTFAGNLWGFCVYNQRSSNCGGSAIAPNPAGRTPSICAECANLLVTGAHAPFWKELVKRNTEIVNAPGASPQAVAVAEKRIEEASKFLEQVK